MIIRSEYRQFDESCLRLRTADPSGCLFFDIETTGFKPAATHLYLICLAEKVHDRWKITQLFGEKPTEEAAILRTFAQIVRPYRQIVTFNGEQFDIGYLEDKYAAYGIESPLQDKESIDLYRDIRTLRRFLQMPHMNQKSLEKFLGLSRDDMYDGGQLIQVYHSYVKTGSEELLEQLLLHNFEDVCGMFTVTKLYAFLSALEELPDSVTVSLEPDQSMSVRHPEAASPGSADISEAGTAAFSFSLRVPVPVPVRRTSGKHPVTVLLHDNICQVQVPYLAGRMLYFLEPCKDYYYLPEEDEAIHKDVAVYVDRAHRRKAVPSNCYTHQSGLFLPEPVPHFTPVLRQSYRDPLSWFRVEEDFAENQDLLTEYIQLLLRFIR